MVDVMVTDLGAVDIDEDLLSVAELGRALSFGSPAMLTEYLAAHTWLRRRLAEYLDYPAEEIEFELGEYGKPRVVKPATDLRFSLAYSDLVAVLAVGFRRDMGVDIEGMDRAKVNPGVTDRVLAPAERQSLAHALDPVRTFLRFWVRKEALAKATGIGVDRNMETTDVSGVGTIDVDGYEITDLMLGDRLVAAVALHPGSVLNVTFDDAMTAPGTALPPLQPAAVAS